MVDVLMSVIIAVGAYWLLVPIVLVLIGLMSGEEGSGDEEDEG